MQYRKDKKGNDISVLGYGCMRFTKKGGSIDIDKAEQEVMAAIRAGVNYFDTAYVYPGNEAAVGEIIERNHCRRDIYLATKLPHYLIKSVDGAQRLFREELKRLRTDYIDYYLMHMLTDIPTWEKLKKLGIADWLEKKRASGEIRNIGFSYHGNTEMFRRLVDLLPETAKELFRRDEKGRTPAELAFKWLYDQPEVTCVLSGMNSMEMVGQNVKTACDAVPGCMTDDDKALIEQVKAEIQKYVRVGCTGCGYCMPCPKGVDIPGTFRCYNAIYSEGKRSGRRDYLQCTAFRRDTASASQCIGCGKCETHCPQQLPIRSELKAAAGELEGVRYKVMKTAIRVFRLW